MSVMRVPLGDPPRTTRAAPLARCRSISDDLSRRQVGKPGGLAASSSSWSGIASNIDFTDNPTNCWKVHSGGARGARPLPYSGRAPLAELRGIRIQPGPADCCTESLRLLFH